MTSHALTVFNYNQPFYRLPDNLWADILYETMPVSQDNGVLYAKAREQRILISKPIASVVETDTRMWSDIHVGSHVLLDTLDLAIKRSKTAPLTVSLGFTDLDYDSEHPLTDESFVRIRSILDLLAPHSDRFRSFGLTTEHPVVYTCVHALFEHLPASLLVELDLDFWYMMQFGGYPALEPLYAAPLYSRTWFGDAYRSLRILRTTSANLHWHIPNAFVNLTRLEVVDIILHPSLTWSTFESLFATATSLTHLRLGNILPFDLPPYGTLTSHSITTFDISFDEQGVLAIFASRLVFPALLSLIYRMDECEFLPPALLLRDMLAQVKHFAFHGTARDAPSMAKMYSFMKRVTELDLSESRGYPLRVLYDHMKALSLDPAQPALVPPVRTLHLRFADHECLRLLLLLYKSSLTPDGRSMDIRKSLADTLLTFNSGFCTAFSTVPYFSSFYGRTLNQILKMSNPGVEAASRDGQVHVPTPIAANLPNELLTAIFVKSCTVDGPCDIDKWLKHRDVLRLISRDVLRFVDAKALFWSRILLTPRNIERFPVYVDAARQGLIHVTVRFPDGLADETDGDSALHDRIALLRESMIAYAADELHRCAGLSIQAMSHSSAEYLLLGLEGSYARRLQYISAGFATHEFHDCEDANFLGCTFASPPAFGVPFTPATTLSILPSSQQLSTITYVSSTHSSCVVRQARDQELDWESVMDIINPRGYLSNLILRDVMWTEGPFAVRSPYPLSTITTLDIAFCGNVAMADFVSHLNLPRLHTLVIRFASEADLRLISRCGALLVSAHEVRLVAEPSFVPGPSFSVGLISIFGRFNRVHSLDLSVGHPAFLSSLVSASSERSLGQDINWNACPTLDRLILASDDLGQARRLVAVRASVGYPELGYVGLGDVDFTDFIMPSVLSRALPYWLPPESSFPSELISEVAGWMCGNYFDNSDAFLLNRAAFLLVNRTWLEAGLATRSLWIHCDFHPRQKADNAEFMISQIKSSLVDFRIKLDDYYFSIHHRSDEVSSRRLISLATDYALQIRRLRVNAGSGNVLQDWVTRVCDRPLPNLTSLTILSTRYILTYSYATTEKFTPALVEPPRLDSLRYLRLSGFVLSWTHMHIYANLTALVLQYFPELLSPTRKQLHAVLSAASGLVQLSLRDLHCGSEDGRLPAIDLPLLRDLDVRLGGYEGVSDVLSIVHAPELREVAVSFEHWHQTFSDLQLLIRCGSLLAKVESFTATGSSGNSPIVGSLYRLMPALRVLDISDIHLNFFRTLTERSDPPFLPMLSHLSISEVPRLHLTEMFDARRSLPRLSVLRVRILDPRVSRACGKEDLVYMESQVECLELPYIPVESSVWMDDWWFFDSGTLTCGQGGRYQRAP
ncbi:hypothetical protein C8R43DRAFT_955511 [Mycena crocata]|nr:hypothetical protein C8R43DRAFT_955511 [Mycena crocata]